MPVPSLTWSQVNAWRMAQQGLSRPLGTDSLLDAVRCTGVMHAQVMPAAELALGARADTGDWRASGRPRRHVRRRL